MVNSIVLGCHYGDEGKGAVTNRLAQEHDVIIRFQAGPNAGHTIVTPAGQIALHQIPCGITIPGKINIIGNGCVINLEKLLKEIEGLRVLGFDVSPQNLLISDRVHVINEDHIQADKQDGGGIGTTGQGIGPCYRDKIARTGTRAMDLDRVKALQPFLCDCTKTLYNLSSGGKSILFEGAQGTFLDIDHGTYPYVTSSNTTIGAAFTGTGIYLPIHRRIGVVKAYMTRVGNGPFPTEMIGQEEPIAEYLRKKGHEYGATTGRPRRIGWLDLHSTNRACIINGINELALTRLDILSGLEQIKISLPGSKPLSYYTIPGWKDEIRGEKEMSALPTNCQRYIYFIEDQLRLPATSISTGPSPEEMIERPR